MTWFAFGHKQLNNPSVGVCMGLAFNNLQFGPRVTRFANVKTVGVRAPISIRGTNIIINIWRDDPKGPATTANLSDNDSDDGVEEEVTECKNNVENMDPFYLCLAWILIANFWLWYWKIYQDFFLPKTEPTFWLGNVPVQTIYFCTSISSNSQEHVPEVPFICLCKLCPLVPETDSKCCCSEANIKAAIDKESASCVIKLKKMSKIWDTVR